MKSERRHELKTNSLAKNLENAPAFFQQHGSRILLGVIVCLLAYILVHRYYIDKENKAQSAAKELGGALYYLNELRNIPPQIAPEELVNLRREYARDAESSLTEALSNTENPKIRAQVFVARGDLNWQLASFPVLPGATTRPDQLGPDKTRDEYLSAAADAYSDVLKPPLDQDHLSVTAARFSLAKIAEDRGEWDKARDYYQQLINDAALDNNFKEMARASQEELKTLEKPIFLGSSKPKVFGPEAPSTDSSTTSPTTAPSVPTTTLVPTTAPATSVPTTTLSVPTTRAISAP